MLGCLGSNGSEGILTHIVPCKQNSDCVMTAVQCTETPGTLSQSQNTSGLLCIYPMTRLTPHAHLMVLLVLFPILFYNCSSAVEQPCCTCMCASLDAALASLQAYAASTLKQDIFL